MSYIAFPFLADSTYHKPNKFNKDAYPTLNEKYHLDFGKWALFNANEAKHTDWLKNIYRNKRFYMGHQWDGREDVESFLQDKTGKARNRIKVSFNQVRPMVEQYRGNAIRLAIGTEAKSVSKNAKVRKERALTKLLLTQEISKEFQALGEVIKSQNPEIKDSKEETELIFENVYVDKYVQNINRLINYVAEYNDMEEFQVKIAENMAFAGIGTIEEFRHGEHHRKEVVEPEEFFWDRNARRPDLQDSAYMGRLHQMSLPDIYERWQGLTLDDRKALESYVSTEGNVNTAYGATVTRSNVGNSVPVYKTFFMDDTHRTAGYVEDEFGQAYLTYINEEDKFKKGKIYTESDLITPPDTEDNRKLFKGKKKRNVVVGILRYVIFIPGEAVNYKIQDTKSKKDVFSDIVMEWGEYDYQETHWLDLSRNRYPFKSYCWAYVDGMALSPIDDIIDPQRFMNRIMSAIESQVNNSGGAGIIYDKDMIAEGDDESEMLRAAYNGDPIGIRTRGKGVPNTIGTYDNTVKGGTYQMFGLINTLKDLMQTVTGVNEGLTGESTGSDQLVGVTQLMIQRGSLMQEPFYNAIARVFIQSHQATATFGKQIYIDNQRELAQIVGDEGVEVFKLAEGMRNEDFRVFITRSASVEQQQQQADQVLFILLQNQLIDQKFFADMIGRSTVSQINSKLRQTVNKQLLAQQQAEKEQLAAQEAAVAQSQEAEVAAIDEAKKSDLEEKEFAVAVDERNKNHEAEMKGLDGVIANQQQVSQQGAQQ